MPNFIHKELNQMELVALNYEAQLQPGTFEYAIHYLIENKADLSFFYSHYKNDKTGRPAHHPYCPTKNYLICLF